MKIGILGGGQLAQMMAIEGKAQGHEFMFLSDDPHSCAAPFGELVCASFDDTRAQDRLAKWADMSLKTSPLKPSSALNRA